MVNGLHNNLDELDINHNVLLIYLQNSIKTDTFCTYL